ncbi:MAG: sulfite exporter TauE/SafE family protein [Chloroflexota bacterium]
MSPLYVSLLTGFIFFLAALLYSSVGHAGASAYLGVMALLGVSPEVMKPTALVLNILVATVASLKYYRAGCFSWRLFWPFALTSIPFACLGGAIALPLTAYRLVLGAVLVYVAVRLIWFPSAKSASSIPPSRWLSLLAGAAIGLLSGLVGVGGGIFLSPLLLLMGWAEPRTTSAVSAVFILVNSIAGLLGNVASTAFVPPQIPLWAAAALAGGWIGSDVGSRRLHNVAIRRLLAIVLLAAGIKMALL